MKLFILSIILIGALLSSCRNGNDFLAKIAPPPAPAPAPEAPPEKSMPGILPMPTAIPYPIPHASDAEKQSWQNHDLKVLAGCWTLGEDRVLTCYNGGISFPCTFSALSVCFDEKGTSPGASLYYDYNGIRHDCEIPMQASFTGDDHILIKSTAEVECTNNFNYDVLDQYDCAYTSAGLANCVYSIPADPSHPDNGRQMYLKRAKKTKPKGS